MSIFKINYIVFLSFTLFVICFWNRNDLSENMYIAEELNTIPNQIKVDQPDFEVTVNKVDYLIQPLYEYELYGLVVSYELHDGNYNLHKRWNDHLNLADYCVVWGKNASSSYLNDINFWNGQFTCNFSTRDHNAWENFQQNELSNNHLISADKFIRKKLRKVDIGDQIVIKGWLANYTNLTTGNTRETSTVRDDQGNGACETIYVTNVSILKAYNNLWSIFMYLFLLIFITSLVLYFKAPHKARN